MIGHRFQAHLVIPGLFILVLLVLYFFGNLFLQSTVAPGFYELPLTSGGMISLPGLMKVYFLVWILVLAVRTTAVSPDFEVEFVSIVVAAGTVLTLMSWGDDNNFASRVWSGITDAETLGDTVSGLLDTGWLTVGFVVISLLSIVFFVVVPVLYGGSRNAVIAILAPSRWMIATVALMFMFFKFAHSLQAQGWGGVQGVEGALGEDVSLFIVLVFQYMVLLHMTEMNYLSVVRKEAPLDTWRLRH